MLSRSRSSSSQTKKRRDEVPPTKVNGRNSHGQLGTLSGQLRLDNAANDDADAWLRLLRREHLGIASYSQNQRANCAFRRAVAADGHCFNVQNNLADAHTESARLRAALIPALKRTSVRHGFNHDFPRQNAAPAHRDLPRSAARRFHPERSWIRTGWRKPV